MPNTPKAQPFLWTAKQVYFPEQAQCKSRHREAAGGMTVKQWKALKEHAFKSE
jgi:hypothetical protein